MGLLPTASQQEIKGIWRKLSKEYHPDKIKDDSKKRAAELRYMEIQNAYDKLSKRRKNKKLFDEL